MEQCGCNCGADKSDSKYAASCSSQGVTFSSGAKLYATEDFVSLPQVEAQLQECFDLADWLATACGNLLENRLASVLGPSIPQLEKHIGCIAEEPLCRLADRLRDLKHKLRTSQSVLIDICERLEI